MYVISVKHVQVLPQVRLDLDVCIDNPWHAEGNPISLLILTLDHMGRGEGEGDGGGGVILWKTIIVTMQITEYQDY